MALEVFSNEGESIYVLKDVPSTTSQEQFIEMIYKAIGQEYGDVVTDTPFEGALVKDSDYVPEPGDGMERQEMLFREYMNILRSFAQDVLSGDESY